MLQVPKSIVRYFVTANEAEHTKALHPAAARTVTNHGDFHNENYLLNDDGKSKGLERLEGAWYPLMSNFYNAT